MCCLCLSVFVKVLVFVCVCLFVRVCGVSCSGSTPVCFPIKLFYNLEINNYVGGVGGGLGSPGVACGGLG